MMDLNVVLLEALCYSLEQAYSSGIDIVGVAHCKFPCENGMGVCPYEEDLEELGITCKGFPDDDKEQLKWLLLTIDRLVAFDPQVTMNTNWYNPSLIEKVRAITVIRDGDEDHDSPVEDCDADCRTQWEAMKPSGMWETKYTIDKHSNGDWAISDAATGEVVADDQCLSGVALKLATEASGNPDLSK